MNNENSGGHEISSSSSNCTSSSDMSEDALAEGIYKDLMDDIIFGLALQTHRAVKLDYLMFVDPDSDSELDKQFEIYEDADVLGVFRNLNENSNKVTSKHNDSRFNLFFK